MRPKNSEPLFISSRLIQRQAAATRYDTAMTCSSVCAMALAAQLVSVAPRNVQIIPLNNETDPVQVTRGQFDVTDAGVPILTLTLTNRTRVTVNTGDVWVSFARFFTRDEMRQNGNNIAWDCAVLGNASPGSPADVRTRPHAVDPGAQTTVMLPIPPNCRLDHAHEHFFAYVYRITTGRGNSVVDVWQRELGDALRVLLATPHR
jgi:hypothetical protein